VNGPRNSGSMGVRCTCALLANGYLAPRKIFAPRSGLLDPIKLAGKHAVAAQVSVVTNSNAMGATVRRVAWNSGGHRVGAASARQEKPIGKCVTTGAHRGAAVRLNGWNLWARTWEQNVWQQGVTARPIT